MAAGRGSKITRAFFVFVIAALLAPVTGLAVTVKLLGRQVSNTTNASASFDVVSDQDGFVVPYSSFGFKVQTPKKAQQRVVVSWSITCHKHGADGTIGREDGEERQSEAENSGLILEAVRRWCLLLLRLGGRRPDAASSPGKHDRVCVRPIGLRQSFSGVSPSVVSPMTASGRAP